MDRYKKQNGLDECYGLALIQAILLCFILWFHFAVENK
jgi:hypothetical protein